MLSDPNWVSAMHEELENPSVGVSGATTKLQTYWDKMGVEK
jgi:hypothetical protein